MMDPTLFRCHDYKFLIQRWRKVARAARLKLQPFAEAGGHELFALTSRTAPEGGIYFSAGIHGDEPAGTEGLLRWAAANTAILRDLPCLLFPCLNPWGLLHNTRLDEQGRDLNRTFHHDGVPQIQALKVLIRPYRFTLSMTLHEDYDGQGLYVYEVERAAPFWGEAMLERARPFIPIEGRTTIDGRRAFKAGLMRRKIDPKGFPEIPEAIYLHQHHSKRTFTIETPSEFALEQRVRVQMELLDEAVRRALAEIPGSSSATLPAPFILPTS